MRGAQAGILTSAINFSAAAADTGSNTPRTSLPMSILTLDDHFDPATVSRNAQHRLCASPYFYLRNLRCEVRDGVLVLEGRVPFAPLREFAEAIVSRVDGVRRVVNRIEVYDPEFAAQRAKGA
jgi:osmotically-inducible protein OsmY